MKAERSNLSLHGIRMWDGPHLAQSWYDPTVVHPSFDELWQYIMRLACETNPHGYCLQWWSSFPSTFCTDARWRTITTTLCGWAPRGRTRCATSTWCIGWTDRTSSTKSPVTPLGRPSTLGVDGDGFLVAVSQISQTTRPALSDKLFRLTFWFFAAPENICTVSYYAFMRALIWKHRGSSFVILQRNKYLPSVFTSLTIWRVNGWI